MSFDDVTLDLRAGFNAVGGPAFQTEIVQLANGSERRNQNWAGSRRRYQLQTTLRTAAATAALLNFFQARAGRARGFRWRDAADFSTAADHVGNASATDVLLGIGNGAQTTFQLRKIYSSGGQAAIRILTKPISGTVLVALNSVPQMSGWSVNHNTGLLTFAVAPAAGVNVMAGCWFEVPVRFDQDELLLTQPEIGLQTANIVLVELR